MKKILLATGIFYPDVGGPAIHTRHIADEIVKRGGYVHVLTYGGPLPPDTASLPYPVTRIPRSFPSLIRWALYTLTVFRYAFWADIIYAFDLSSAGVPAACAAAVARRQFFIRIGGDPIWERVVERGERFLSLKEYYEHGYYKKDRPFLFFLIRFVLSRASMVIICLEMFSDFYVHYFGVNPKRISVIPNPLPAVPHESKNLPVSPLTLYAGRFVAYKNLSFVLRAFVRVHLDHPESRLILIGSGPEFESISKMSIDLNFGDAVQVLPAVAHEQLEQYQHEASLALAPALTEFNPNFALESLSRGIPVLISRDNGLTVRLPHECLFDPTDEDELYVRWSTLLNPTVYQEVTRRIVKTIPCHTWTEVEAAHAKLLGL